MPLLAALLAAIASPVAGGQQTAPSVRPPDPIALHSGWQFAFDAHDQGRNLQWQTGDWGNQTVADVTVPHVFDPNPAPESYWGTIGWYRLRFPTPATPAGFGWALRFEGARRAARVWLNGKLIGVNNDPYEPFTLPASNLRQDGQDNVLVVRVHNIRPKELREGWWNWGGLVRPVTLIPQGRVMYQDLGIMSDVACKPGATTCAAIVRTDGWVVNRTKSVQNPVLFLQLRSPHGDVTNKTVKVSNLQPGEKRRVGFPVHIVGAPQLWSPIHANLYDAYVEVRLGGNVSEVQKRRVGLRYIRVVNGELSLNGHPLNLRGASIQEDLPGKGPALDDGDFDTIVGDLKALGANVTRAQYPLSDRLLDKLDQAGILVWSQAPVYHADRDLRSVAGRRQAYSKVRATVLNDRNHPSVMTHSVANELTVRPDHKPGTRSFMLHAARIVRNLDSTVPAALDLLSYPGIPKQRAYSGFGLLGINSYYGWYTGKAKRRSVAKLSDLPIFLARMREMYPRQAMMITEFGAEATMNGPSTQKQTFAFQSSYVDRTLDIVDHTNWLSGAIYWTAREFYVKPDWDGGGGAASPHDSLHHKGLITYDGHPKPAFYAAKKRFAETLVYKTGLPAPEPTPDPSSGSTGGSSGGASAGR